MKGLVLTLKQAFMIIIVGSMLLVLPVYLAVATHHVMVFMVFVFFASIAAKLFYDSAVKAHKASLTVREQQVSPSVTVTETVIDGGV